MLPTRKAELTRGLLTPHRSGVEAPGGCEELIHAVRQLAHEHRQENRIGLLSLYFKNPYNLVSRACARTCQNSTARSNTATGRTQRRKIELKNVECAMSVRHTKRILWGLLFTLAPRRVLLRFSEKLRDWCEESGADGMETE